MSRRQLALKAGIAPSSFQSAMQRNGSLSLDMLFPISDALDVSVAFLAGVSDETISDDALEEMEKHYRTRVLDEIDTEFYYNFQNLSDDDKETIRRMVEVMRERRKKPPQD